MPNLKLSLLSRSVLSISITIAATQHTTLRNAPQVATAGVAD